MAEGRVYHCVVEEAPGEVRMWLQRRPAVRGSGSTWDEAYEELIGAICEKLGDGEPRVSFSGLIPTIKEDRPFIDPRWTEAYQNGECPLWWNTDRLFPEGICGLCGQPRGVRNREPLVACGGGRGDYCSADFVWDSTPRTFFMKAGFDPLIVSEQFLEQLTDAERAACDWVGVVMPARCRKRYFECIPRRFIAYVGHARWENEYLRCGECGRGTPRTSPIGDMRDFNTMRLDHWLAAGDVAGMAAAPLFAAGRPDEFHLVWPVSRALSLVKTSKARGMTLFSLGVIPDGDVLRTPPHQDLATAWKTLRADAPGSDWNPVRAPNGYPDNPCDPAG